MRCPRIIPREKIIKRGALTKLVRVPTRCGGTLAFYGIAPRHRRFGWRRWDQCDQCGFYTASDAHGSIRAMQEDEPPKFAFPSLGLVTIDEARAA